MTNPKNLAGFLIILNPPELAGKVPFYLGTNIVGRSEAKSNLLIPHPSISQKHAILKVVKSSVTVADVGSKNGTKINTEDNRLEKAQEVKVYDAMIIYFAQVKCKIELNLDYEQPPPKESNTAKVEKQAKRAEIMNLINNVDQENIEKEQKSKLKQVPDLPPHKNQIEAVNYSNQFDLEEGFGDNPKKKTKKASKKGQEPKEEQKHASEKADKAKQQKKVPEKKIQANSKLEKPEAKNKSEANETKRASAEREDKAKENKNNKPKRDNKKKESPMKTKAKDENEQDNKAKSNPAKVEPKRKSKQRINRKSASPQKEQPPQIIIHRPPKDKKRNQQKHKSFDDSQNSHSTAKKRRQSKKKISESMERELITSDNHQMMIPTRRHRKKKVMFSGFIAQLSRKYFEETTDIADDFDFLVMKEYKRTVKALIAICRGIPIVRFEWIQESEYYEKMLKYQYYCFKGCSQIYDAIELAKDGHKVFEGYDFFLASKQYHLTQQEIQKLMEASGGTLITKLSKDLPKSKKARTTIVLVRNKVGKDSAYDNEVKVVQKQGFDKIYTIQFFLDACQQQRISWDKNTV